MPTFELKKFLGQVGRFAPSDLLGKCNQMPIHDQCSSAKSRNKWHASVLFHAQMCHVAFIPSQRES